MRLHKSTFKKGKPFFIYWTVEPEIRRFIAETEQVGVYAPWEFPLQRVLEVCGRRKHAEA